MKGGHYVWIHEEGPHIIMCGLCVNEWRNNDWMYMYNRELSRRLVESGSLGFAYSVDLRKMKQTNSSTGKVRDIRRMLTNFKAGGAGSAAATTPTQTAAVVR